MNKLYSYRQFVAGTLVLMFLLSVTPKRFLHDSFAKHIDDCKLNNSVSVANKNNTIASVGFNCKIDDLVVEGFFMQAAETIVVNKNLFSNEYLLNEYCLKLLSNHNVSRLRGPPIEMPFI